VAGRPLYGIRGLAGNSGQDLRAPDGCSKVAVTLSHGDLFGH
jgi:hypothetical protein